MKNSVIKKIVTVLLIIVIVVFAVFQIGRYGWKLFGFTACESAGIERVEVTGESVRIAGFYPGSFPEGFLGYYSKQIDSTLYVGFRFSGLFGIFETGDFDITIPTDGRITEVIVKTGDNEYSVWPHLNAVQALPAADGDGAYESGVYVSLERSDIYSLGWFYENKSGGMINADNTALEQGKYIYLDNDIFQTASNLERPVPFMLTAADNTGQTVIQTNLVFDPLEPVLLITFTAAGDVLVNGKSVEESKISAAYEAIIAQYRNALTENWSGQQLVDAGMNYMVRDVTPEQVGYAVDDLDGNGSDELAIGTLSGDEFYGRLIFELYTLDETGNAVLIFSSTERDRYYYAGGVRFANLGSSAFDDSFETTLKLENGEMIDMTYTTAPEEYVQLELIQLVP